MCDRWSLNFNLTLRIRCSASPVSKLDFLNFKKFSLNIGLKFKLKLEKCKLKFGLQIEVWEVQVEVWTSNWSLRSASWSFDFKLSFKLKFKLINFWFTNLKTTFRASHDHYNTPSTQNMEIFKQLNFRGLAKKYYSN